MHAACARVEGRGESGHPTGGRSSALSPEGATAIEGTSCGLGAKLEGAAAGAYAEKHRFVPGFPVKGVANWKNTLARQDLIGC